jgi:thioredoxin 1
MSENVKVLTAATFEGEVLKSDRPVLVDFWAEWCGPCKMMAPVLDDVAKELEGQVKVAKINVDDHGDIAAKYGVMSIPTFILFKNGVPVERFVGAMPKNAFKAKLQPVLA